MYTPYILLALCIGLPWLYRYRIKPYFENKKLYADLKKRHNWPNIKKTEHFLQTLYQDAQGNQISKQERARLNIQEDAFVYGEITFFAFYRILEKTKPRPNEIFYDIGSGAGKPVLAAALFFQFSKVYGIEFLPALYNFSNEQVTKAKVQADKNTSILRTKWLKNLSAIEFIEGSYLEHSFSNGDIIFINATCISFHTWDKILKKLMALKVGSRVILTSKKIEHPSFSIIYQGRDLMSWGMNSVNIYIKTNETNRTKNGFTA